MTAAPMLFILAAATSLGLGLVAVARRPRGPLRWSFALGMAGFAVESAAALVLVTQTDAPDERLFWLRTTKIAGLLLLIPWGVFVAGLARRGGGHLSRRLRAGLGVAALVVMASAAAVAYLPAFQVADVAGAFYAARVDVVGRMAVIVELVASVALLAGLEAALRASRRDARSRIKYLVLGLSGVLLGRFYFLSQVALFNVEMASYLITDVAILLIGNVAIAASMARDRLGVELAVSRHVLYRSVVVGALGVYLFAVGVLGWLLNRLGIGEELFFGSVVVFVSALGLAAVLLSEAVRWRVKRFVTRNFYRSKYDYRVEWVNSTKRLGSLVTLGELAPQLLGTVVETVGATAGVLYLDGAREGGFRAATAVGTRRPTPTLAEGHPLIVTLAARRTPLVLENGAAAAWFEPPVAQAFPEASVIVPLRWHDELTGFLLIGPEQTGVPYTLEDLEFMETIGEQAAGVIDTARLSEGLAQSREFEAFHRLTSFVIHDLKNSISALSMLSENALKHFDDPEFQRDALTTVARTVDRMKALLGRLSAAPEPARLRLEPVDLATLALEVASPVVKSGRISLVKELAPRPILADAEALSKVIQNLVTNAVQSIDGHGTVTVKTFEEHGRAVLSVTDTGCGMSEEFVRTSLFAPFRSTKKGGWGIGLYHAKGLVEAHGGTIDVESTEGTGTTFSVRLPIGDRT
ncbi:MAG: PEP-CTERM system histidine kinase PrsK [Candidatus Rokuibacteriota bacterium]|nr:MAG: PEP-CTERM system histidine kinase PrsK [Candidatus Rokubacteria bacterium]